MGLLLKASICLSHHTTIGNSNYPMNFKMLLKIVQVPFYSLRPNFDIFFDPFST